MPYYVAEFNESLKPTLYPLKSLDGDEYIGGIGKSSIPRKADWYIEETYSLLTANEDEGRSARGLSDRARSPVSIFTLSVSGVKGDDDCGGVIRCEAGLIADFSGEAEVGVWLESRNDINYSLWFK